MLSRKELKEKYEAGLKEFSIRRQTDEKKFAESYLDKALHNLELAGILDMISRDEKTKKAIEINPDREYFDWIIITSYYAMYLAATAALAKIGLKCTTHGSTILALEYRFCIDKNLLERRYIDMIEQAHFGKDDIQKLDTAMRGRITVQYTVSKRYGDNEAKRILRDAKEFVKKISEIMG